MFSKDSCALLTDLYQIKMAYGYWNNGHRDSKAVYHLYFRQAPFDQTFAIFCGLGSIIEFIQSFKFSKSDVEYLGSLKTPCNKPLFPTDFLSFLESMQLTCSIYAPPEGTLVLPKTPLLRVEGPIIECQLLESILLNFINFQTLIATKAARVALAAGSDKVLEFGLRRAQGVDRFSPRFPARC